MVEFVLTAPLLFLIFFALIQGAALGWTALTVQRAADAVARHASRAGADPKSWDSPRLQALVALAPLVGLNKAYLVSGAFTQVEVQEDGDKTIATLRFPMPLWVPLAGPWLGERLVPPLNGWGNTTRDLFSSAFRLLGRTPPDLDAPLGALPYYRWITFRSEEAMEPSPLPDAR